MVTATMDVDSYGDFLVHGPYCQSKHDSKVNYGAQLQQFTVGFQVGLLPISPRWQHPPNSFSLEAIMASRAAAAAGFFAALSKWNVIMRTGTQLFCLC